MVQLFDPASNTFWRNVKERAVAPVTAFGRNPVRWDTWQPQHVPAVSQWYYLPMCCVYAVAFALAVLICNNVLVMLASRKIWVCTQIGSCNLASSLCSCGCLC